MTTIHAMRVLVVLQYQATTKVIPVHTVLMGYFLLTTNAMVCIFYYNIIYLYIFILKLSVVSRITMKFT